MAVDVRERKERGGVIRMRLVILENSQNCKLFVVLLQLPELPCHGIFKTNIKFRRRIFLKNAV
jgi:hypothetical protein